MAIDQGALTVVAPIEPGELESLRALLEKIGDDIQHNTSVSFAELTTTHFARWVIMPEARDAHGGTITPSLVFISYFDVPPDEHLDQLVRVAGAGLHEIYGHCKGFPAPLERTPESLLAYLRRHTVPNAATYAGTRGRSVAQIRQDASLREAIEDFIDRHLTAHAPANGGSREIRRAIQAFVTSEQALSWARSPATPWSLSWRARHYAKLGAFVVLAGTLMLGLPALVTTVVQLAFGLPLWAWPAIFVPLAAALPVGFLVLLRTHEKREAARSTDDDYEHIGELVEREDRVGQNPMTWVINVKPGWFRLLTLRLVMFLTGLGTSYVFTRGKLLDIPTVHFAHWGIVDRNRRLLFLSNFDGSWESYVGDFVDKAAWGLTAIWSNTVGFADTRWLVLGGARSERHFKGTHRDNEPPTQVFFSAYPQLSVDNIYNNSRIRAGLWGELDERAAQEWLQLL